MPEHRNRSWHCINQRVGRYGRDCSRNDRRGRVGNRTRTRIVVGGHGERIGAPVVQVTELKRTCIGGLGDDF